MARAPKIDWDLLSSVRFQEDGLASFRGVPELMPVPHRHNEIEFNFLDSGSMTYLFGGTAITVSPGYLAVFWAGTPHQVIRVAPGTRHQWLTLPLGAALQWKLPGPLLRRLLFSKILMETDPGMAAVDRVFLRRWNADLKARPGGRRALLLLELEARLRRLGLGLKEGAVRPKEVDAGAIPLSEGGLEKAGQMALAVSERYSDAVKVEDIARAVGLRPNRAMRLFRRAFGTTLMDYVTQLRLMHAQRMLTLSDAKMVDVALESGFGSLSSFYEAFSQACRQSPGDYRRSVAGRAA